MPRLATLLIATAALAACDQPRTDAPPANAVAPAGPAQLSLTRLDCGSATIKDFDAFFSDRPGLYAKGPREITDSCYLIRHRSPMGDRAMVWDTGFAAGLKGRSQDMGELVARLGSTIAEQLARLGLKPGDVDIVGISHMHPDHTGQAAQFPNAALLIGKRDFEQTAGKDDPFGPWRGAGKAVTLVGADHDVFGDGSVTALHLPGHTPDHLALLVKLASGPVLLSGDLYHSTEARAKRGVPPFNTDRAQTLASMDRF
ncbi:MAG TPA: N-acyl homoserine lactonase family protein, partial [Sphingomicrobium sp.]|nr:N-acyl homoserine lactonase family protein [Sphingomicrobium sp.]